MSRQHVALDRRRWSVVRRRVFERDKYRCCRCGRSGRLEADHVEPLKSWAGCLYDMGNIQTLCRSCHIEKTAEENRNETPSRRRWRELVAEMTA